MRFLSHSKDPSRWDHFTPYLHSPDSQRKCWWGVLEVLCGQPMCEVGQRESWSGRCQLREAERVLAPGGACVGLLLLTMSFYSVFWML